MTAAVRVRGSGVVCALGVGNGAVSAAIDSGRPSDAFRGASSSCPAYPSPFDPARDLPRGLGRRLGRQLAMTLAAAIEAMETQTGSQGDPAETAIVAATAHGPIHETVDFMGSAVKAGVQYASPSLFAGSQHGSMVGVVARELGLRGPAIVVSNGEVSFESALLVAAAGLANGRMPRALVVGADAFHPLYARSLATFGLLADTPSPVDPAMQRTMRGVHLGEGAGALLLEAGPREDEGVYLDELHLGMEPVALREAPARIEAMSSGDAASARRHRQALESIGLGGAEVCYPAARFGAFASLSAVAIATEAARRRSVPPGAAPTLFLTVPADAPPASALLRGGGR